MVRRNKKNRTALVVFGIVVFIAALITLFIFGFQQAAFDIGAQCYVIEENSRVASYTCPPSATRCDLFGVASCTEQTGEVANVVLRTNGNINLINNPCFTLESCFAPLADRWIAVATQGSGPLEGFETSRTGGQLRSLSHGDCFPGELDPNREYITTWQDYHFCEVMAGTFEGNIIAVQTTPTESQGLLFRPNFNSPVVLNVLPTEPFTSNGQEISGEGGQNLFQCQSVAMIDGVVVETATYSADSQGTYETEIHSLEPEQTFSFPADINYVVIDESNACDNSVCNFENTGFFACSSPPNGCKELSSSITTCTNGNVCVDSPSGASCGLAIESSGQFINEQGVQRTGYAPDEPIILEYFVNSQSFNSANVVFTLRDLNNQEVETRTRTINFPTADSSIIQFNNPGIGEYDVLVETFADGSTIPIVDGPFETRVSEELFVTITTINSVLTTNEEFIVEIRTFSDSERENEINVDGISVLGSVGNTDFDPIGDIDHISTGIYQATFNIDTEGIFQVDANIVKSDLEQTFSREFNVGVKMISVIFTNTALLDNALPGTYTVSFETKDAGGNLIETTNEVFVLVGGGILGGDEIFVGAPSGSEGKYSFEYNFDAEGGFKVIVQSSADGFDPRRAESPFFQISSTGEDVSGLTASSSLTCVIATDCPGDHICDAGICIGLGSDQPSSRNLMLILVALAIVVVIGGVLFAVNRRKKRGKKRN